MLCLCWIKNTFEVAFFCVAFVCVVANFISWSPMTSLSHKGLVTFYTTVEWSIPNSPLSPLINKWVRIENKFPIIPLYSAWSIKPWLIGGGGVLYYNGDVICASVLHYITSKNQSKFSLSLYCIKYRKWGTTKLFLESFVLYPIIIKIRPHRQSYQINYHSLNLISSSLDDNVSELFPD